MPRKKSAPQQEPTHWRNRIVGYGEEDADQLVAHPLNWRIHPRNQQALIADILDEVGFVAEVMVNRRTGRVVDGHMRVMVAMERGEKVPVRYIDVSEEEEEKILATFDPVGALAFRDDNNYQDIMSRISAEEEALKAFFSQQKREDKELTNVPQSTVELVGYDTRPGYQNKTPGSESNEVDEQSSGSSGGGWQVLSFLLPDEDYRFVQGVIEQVKAKTGVFADHEAIVALCRTYKDENGA